MKQGFDRFGMSAQTAVVSIDQLYSTVRDRMTVAHNKLDPKGEFAKAAKHTPADTMIGGLLLGMLMGGAFFYGLENIAHVPAATVHGLQQLHNGFLTGAFEGASMIRDEKATALRQRALNDYPEGRRADAFEQPLNNKFNLVSGNDNYRFDTDAEAEVAAMAEMLDMIGDLRKEGITALQLDSKGSAYDTLKTVKKDLHRDAVLTRFSTPVRKAA